MATAREAVIRARVTLKEKREVNRLRGDLTESEWLRNLVQKEIKAEAQRRRRMSA